MAAVKLFQNLEPSFEDTKWKIKTTRGEQAEPLIDYIVLAEFDIDTGQLWFDLTTGNNHHFFDRKHSKTSISSRNPRI
jgi:hypothetical protein